MHIFIDESGTFAPTIQLGAWCVVAAYVVGSRDRVSAEETLSALKASIGRRPIEEIKRRDVSEEAYFLFLEGLGSLGGFLVSVATDAGVNDESVRSQAGQVRVIREATNALVSLDDKREAEALALAMEALSPQLYVEIICRMHLTWLAVNVGVSYYVQNEPETLSQIDWHFDAKGGAGAAFERAHGPLMAGLAAEMSRHNPMPFVRGADYSKFGRFVRGGAGALKPADANQTRAGVMVNARRIYRERQAFVDSGRSLGVQIADLLVSRVAALLRGKFSDQEKAAHCLGRLTKRLYPSDHSIYLIGFGNPESSAVIPEVARTAIKKMNETARTVFVRHQELPEANG